MALWPPGGYSGQLLTVRLSPYGERLAAAGDTHEYGNPERPTASPSWDTKVESQSNSISATNGSPGASGSGRTAVSGTVRAL